ncbi:hypothetical protein LF41_2948 [Lysobacter dokdonensis DS-58]|uniref:FG-GAP repeat protein n=1 Tax=Lysobacter dokdonensis DS-58 TaxID=1300345 RepID=A0A0A2WLZ3_9GAMM|nr:VCBS repeat-containing protein [Lysobacter dokdonensis]KGQ19300.1 hypothetical protein LF41_2948 [Lysobacter dokdonensis DS-58]
MSLKHWIALAAVVSGCVSSHTARAEWRLEKPIAIYVGPDARGSLLADMNGDGLLDIVTQYGMFNLWKCGVSVTLQTPDGFSWPATYEIDDCHFEQLALANITPDPGLEIVMRTSFNHPDWSYRMLEYRADTNTLVHVENFGFLGWGIGFGVLDVNQDRRDDLWEVFEDSDSSKPEVTFRYKIAYARANDRLPDGKKSVGWLRGYTSARFAFSGITDQRGMTATSKAAVSQYQVDLDADGYFDAFSGLCPTKCLFRQEPWGQLRTMPTVGETANVFGDIDGDGLPDALLGGRDADGFTIEVALQTAPYHFEHVGTLTPFLRVGMPAIVDMDLNGLADFAFGGENGPGTGAMFVYRQIEPGVFQGSALIDAGWPLFAARAGDLNNDGCPDLLTANELMADHNHMNLYRGVGCEVGDLAVTTDVRANKAVVSVAHVRGTKALALRTMRVNISPAVKDPTPLGFQVRPPEGCVERPADVPRRMFDCVFDMAAGTTREFVFNLSMAAGKEAQVHTIAFLLDEGGDGNPLNNRSRVDAYWRHVTGSADTVPTGIRR